MILQIFLSGLIAAGLMSLFLSLVHRSNLANGDMIRALGILFLGEDKRSLFLGLLLHYCAGIFFATLYASLLAFAPIDPTTGSVVLLFGGVSVFHGLVVSMLLAVELAEGHPLHRFRQASPDLLGVHLAAHLVYGFSLGTLFYLFQINPGQLLLS